MKTLVCILILCVAGVQMFAICPGGFGTVNCIVDPCQFSKCPLHQSEMGVHCKSDYCGGCHAIWFDGKGDRLLNCH